MYISICLRESHPTEIRIRLGRATEFPDSSRVGCTLMPASVKKKTPFT